MKRYATKLNKKTTHVNKRSEHRVSTIHKSKKDSILKHKIQSKSSKSIKVSEIRNSKKNLAKISHKIFHKNNIKGKFFRKVVSKTNKTVPKKTTKILKRAIIVHGWSGDISKGWYPWLKKMLEKQGFIVIMEKMPDPEKPEIESWIEQLRNISGNVDEQTYFVGHSIGCQTIIRMLEKHKAEKVGGAVFLAGWFNLKENTYKEDPKTEKDTRKIAEPWIKTNIDFTKVQPKFSSGKITAIFSDNDPYVDLNNAEAFKKWLDARVIIENGKGHFIETETNFIPVLLEELLRISSDDQIDNQNL